MAQSGKVIILNNSGVSRLQDPVVISRDVLSSFVSMPEEEGKVLVLTEKGRKIPAQLDDINADGRWDELAFQIDIERNSKKEIRLRWVEKEDAPVYEIKTRACLGLSENRNGKYLPVNREIMPESAGEIQMAGRYRSEGPVWENENLAFRHFFDSRNNTDIFGKTRPCLIADSLDLSSPEFLSLQPKGMNILEVKSTLGAGGFALIYRGLPIPLRHSSSAIFRLLASGPVRSVIEFTYEGWRVGDQNYDVRRRISVWAGKNWFKNEIMVSGFTGERELAIGLANTRNPKPPLYITHNLVFNSLCTHSLQSRNRDALGMGLLFPSRIFSGYGQTPPCRQEQPTDTLCHSQFAKIKIRSGELIEYSFFAGWEKSESRFATTRYFTELLQEEADRRENPLQLLAK